MYDLKYIRDNLLCNFGMTHEYIYVIFVPAALFQLCQRGLLTEHGSKLV